MAQRPRLIERELVEKSPRTPMYMQLYGAVRQYDMDGSAPYDPEKEQVSQAGTFNNDSWRRIVLLSYALWRRSWDELLQNTVEKVDHEKHGRYLQRHLFSGEPKAAEVRQEMLQETLSRLINPYTMSPVEATDYNEADFLQKVFAGEIEVEYDYSTKNDASRERL